MDPSQATPPLGLEQLIKQLEETTGSGSTSCVTFGLPATLFSEGSSRLKEELANAAKIQSRL